MNLLLRKIIGFLERRDNLSRLCSILVSGCGGEFFTVLQRAALCNCSVLIELCLINVTLVGLYGGFQGRRDRVVRFN